MLKITVLKITRHFKCWIILVVLCVWNRCWNLHLNEKCIILSWTMRKRVLGNLCSVKTQISIRFICTEPSLFQPSSLWIETRSLSIKVLVWIDRNLCMGEQIMKPIFLWCGLYNFLTCIEALYLICICRYCRQILLVLSSYILFINIFQLHVQFYDKQKMLPGFSSHLTACLFYDEWSSSTNPDFELLLFDVLFFSQGIQVVVFSCLWKKSFDLFFFCK